MAKTTTQMNLVPIEANIHTHNFEQVELIRQKMFLAGVSNFRFCVENDCYVCDIEGNFYSVCKRQYSKTGKFLEYYRLQKLKGSIDKYGYKTYRIAVDGTRKHLKGHRLIMNAWIGEEPDLVVNHLDGDKQNNSLGNLEWCTVADNNAHAIETGLFDPHGSRKIQYKVPLTDWVSIFILHKHCGYSLSELGKMNGCVHDTIKRIIEKLERVMPKEVAYGR